MKRLNYCCLAIILVVAIFSVSNASAADLYLDWPLINDYYYSDSNIIAKDDCEVEQGKWAGLIAANSISFQPGFRVESGAEFGAVIGDYSILPPDLDKDADELPDGWEFTYFADLDETGDGDYDADGVLNYIEFRLGSDPTNINDIPAPVISYEYDALGRIKEIIRISAQ